MPRQKGIANLLRFGALRKSRQVDNTRKKAAFPVRACGQIAPPLLRQPEPGRFGGSTALLRQAIPAPAPATMTKMRLLDACQGNLTTRPGWFDATGPSRPQRRHPLPQRRHPDTSIGIPAPTPPSLPQRRHPGPGIPRRPYPPSRCLYPPSWHLQPSFRLAPESIPKTATRLRNQPPEKIPKNW